MPKKLTNESFKNGWKQALKGVTVEDILSMKSDDLLMLNKSNLSKVVSRVVSATNKRVSAIEKSGLPSEIIKQNVGGKGVRLSVKGKDVAGLMQEWVSAKAVLKTEETTVHGIKTKLRKEVTKRFKEKGVDISKFLGTKKESVFWEALRKLREVGNYTRTMSTNEAVEIISESWKKYKTPDDIIKDMLERVRDIETEKASEVQRVRNSRFDDLGINN